MILALAYRTHGSEFTWPVVEVGFDSPLRLMRARAFKFWRRQKENIMAQRFSYVKYDEESTRKQEEFKDAFERIEALADAHLPEGRAKSLFLTYLEIAYMWTGKAIRDEQIEKNSKPEHVPERG